MAAAVTTTKTKDHLGRAVKKAAGGAGTDDGDYLGRSVKTGNLDFLGRALV